MNRRNFLIVILLFFSKIFTVKCESRKVRLYLFFQGSLYRYFSEKNDEYNNFNTIDDIKALSTDYNLKDNTLDLQEIDEKIKKKEIFFKGWRDIYDGNKTTDFNNCKITWLKLLTDIERKGFSYNFADKLKENFYQYNIEDLKNKVKIPDNVNYVYIFIDDFSNIEIFKKGAIGHLLLRNDNNTRKKEDFTDITDTIKISDLYNNLEYIEKCDYSGNNQLKELLSNKLLNDDKYKNLEFKFKNLTKDGEEKIKIEDLKKMGAFISRFWFNDDNYGYFELKNGKNNNMYLMCDIRFKRKVKIIFNIPEGTELDLGLSMKQETEIEFDSFNQESIETGLKDAINEIFNTKAKLANKCEFGCNFWQGYEGIWPEKYEVKKGNGDEICSISKANNNNYIDIKNENNITFNIYLKPGSEILKGIHVTLQFKPVDGKVCSKELETISEKNTDIIANASSPASVFLCRGDNYIEQLKNILKEGYFNKQKISLDDDCYQLFVKKYEGGEKFIPLTDNSQLENDIPEIIIQFNNNAIDKYLKNNEAAADPVYYGNGKDAGRDKAKFDPNYEYKYTYSYQPVTGNFENYSNYFSKIQSGVKYIKPGDKHEDGSPGDGKPGDTSNQTPITTSDNKDMNNLGCCATCGKCFSKCCCCKRNV